MSELKRNPIFDVLEQGETVIRIEGYVGRNEDGRVDLYPRLDSATCFVINSEDIIQAVEATNHEEATSIFVRDSAKIDIVSSVNAAALRKQRAPGQGALFDACSDFAYSEWLECLDVGYGIDFCNAYSRLIERSCRSGAIRPTAGLALE